MDSSESRSLDLERDTLEELDRESFFEETDREDFFGVSDTAFSSSSDTDFDTDFSGLFEFDALASISTDFEALNDSSSDWDLDPSLSSLSSFATILSVGRLGRMFA